MKDGVNLFKKEDQKLQPLTIALCFGYNNTHPINQRKLRIKERMKDEEM